MLNLYPIAKEEPEQTLQFGVLRQAYQSCTTRRSFEEELSHCFESKYEHTMNDPGYIVGNFKRKSLGFIFHRQDECREHPVKRLKQQKQVSRYCSSLSPGSNTSELTIEQYMASESSRSSSLDEGCTGNRPPIPPRTGGESPGLTASELLHSQDVLDLNRQHEAGRSIRGKAIDTQDSWLELGLGPSSSHTPEPPRILEYPASSFEEDTEEDEEQQRPTVLHLFPVHTSERSHETLMPRSAQSTETVDFRFSTLPLAEQLADTQLIMSSASYREEEHRLPEQLRQRSSVFADPYRLHHHEGYSGYSSLTSSGNWKHEFLPSTTRSGVYVPATTNSSGVFNMPSSRSLVQPPAEDWQTLIRRLGTNMQLQPLFPKTETGGSSNLRDLQAQWSSQQRSWPKLEPFKFSFPMESFSRYNMPPGWQAPAQSHGLLPRHKLAAAKDHDVWFFLRAGMNEDSEQLPQIPKCYLRVKDGTVPVSHVKKYLVHKLGLTCESEVEISCRGQILMPSLSLQHVRDVIWYSTAVAEEGTSTKNFVMELNYTRRRPQFG